MNWGGLRGRGGVDIADIVEVKQGRETLVFEKFGDNRCSDRYVSFVLIPHGDSAGMRTLDLILESRAARDLVARCMRLLLSLHLGEHPGEELSKKARKSVFAKRASDGGDLDCSHRYVDGGADANPEGIQWGATSDTAEAESMKGYLLKESGGRSIMTKVYGKNWKHRYFFLDENFLRYFTDEHFDAMKGSIHISDVADVVVEDDGQVRGGGLHYFQVITTRRRWRLAASMEVERRCWVAAIGQAVDEYRRKKRSPDNSSSTSLDCLTTEGSNGGGMVEDELDLVEKRLRLHRGESLRAPLSLLEAPSNRISTKEALPIAIKAACTLQEEGSAQLVSIGGLSPTGKRSTCSEGVSDSWYLPPAEFAHVRKSVLSSNGTKFELEDFAPEVFFTLRRRFSLTTEAYLASMCDQPLLGGGIGEGKSGSLFFFCTNGNFISKTVTALELEFFVRILPSYYEHMVADGESTLLPRFFGLYKLKLPGKKMHVIVVMNNAFQIPRSVKIGKINEKYDLKGSLRNRCVSKAEIEAGVKVLKDVNFVMSGSKVRLGTILGPEFEDQLKKDVKWLKDNHIMDYSLLLGIAQNGPESNPQGGEAVAPSSESALGKKAEPFRSKWQQENGGTIARRDDDSLGTHTYFLSIIDILQEYNLKKKIEHNYKAKVLRKDPYALSAVNSQIYGNRFVDFIFKEVIHSHDPERMRSSFAERAWTEGAAIDSSAFGRLDVDEGASLSLTLPEDSDGDSDSSSYGGFVHQNPFYQHHKSQN